MSRTSSPGAAFLRTARITHFEDGLFFAYAMANSQPDRWIGIFGNGHGRHVLTVTWDPDELMANLDCPLGCPSPKVRTALFASCEPVGVAPSESRIERWRAICHIVEAAGIVPIDWLVFDGDLVESLAERSGRGGGWTELASA